MKKCLRRHCQCLHHIHKGVYHPPSAYGLFPCPVDYGVFVCDCSGKVGEIHNAQAIAAFVDDVEVVLVDISFAPDGVISGKS